MNEILYGVVCIAFGLFVGVVVASRFKRIRVPGMGDDPVVGLFGCWFARIVGLLAIGFSVASILGGPLTMHVDRAILHPGERARATVSNRGDQPLRLSTTLMLTRSSTSVAPPTPSRDPVLIEPGGTARASAVVPDSATSGVWTATAYAWTSDGKVLKAGGTFAAYESREP